MITIDFEFDGAAPGTLDLFERLPQALAGRSVLVRYRPVAPPAGHPAGAWMRLLAGPPPGRWACEQVLRGGPSVPVSDLAATLAAAGQGADPASDLPLPGPAGPVPALVWAGGRFHGDTGLAALGAALPPA